MKFQAIATLRNTWPPRWLCAAFEVTCAGFYAWLKRPPSARAREDARLTGAIRQSFTESDRTYPDFADSPPILTSAAPARSRPFRQLQALRTRKSL